MRFCSAALWKLEGKKLKNKAGFVLEGEWSIPALDLEGYIKHGDHGDKVLGLEEESEEESKANWEDKRNPAEDLQKWKRSSDRDDGFFTLRNVAKKDLLLHADHNQQLFVGGEMYSPIAHYEDEPECNLIG